MIESAALLERLQRSGDLVRVTGQLPNAFSDVALDSRSVRRGGVFVAINGTVVDGHRFIDDAIARGAVAVVVEQESDMSVPGISVRDTRVAAALLAALACDEPGKDVTMIGVTGTNGKTTCVALIRHLLNGRGHAGSMGTLGAMDGGGQEIPHTPPLTTPGPIELHATLKELKSRGVRSVAMEVSSHALHQRRVAGIEFAAAVYTNLTHEHLDYHADLADYLTAKLSFAEYVASDGVQVVNADTKAWAQLPRVGATVSFGFNESADVTAGSLEPSLGFTDFEIEFGGSRQAVRLPLVGEFNVSNALAAAAAARALGVGEAEICERLETVPQIPGRMEILHQGEFLVLRDYAHTPDAFERVLATLRDATQGRLMILFGCGGDRDRKKRPILAETAGRMTDLAIISTDNPRTESLDRIFADIEQGLEGYAYVKIVDREAAIRRALRMLEPGDTLLLAGKGHEAYQLIGAERIPFNEKAIVAEALGAPA